MTNQFSKLTEKKKKKAIRIGNCRNLMLNLTHVPSLIIVDIFQIKASIKVFK